MHESLITLAQHYEVLEILSNIKKKHNGPRKNGNPRFPLCKHLICERCVEEGRIHKFTGYDNKNGHSDKVYSRYFCRGCNRSMTRDLVHSEIEKVVSELDFTESSRNILLKQLNKVWQVEEELNGNKKSQDLARLQKLKTAKSRMVDSLALPENHSIADDIRDNINAKKQEIDKLERSVSESSEQSDSNRADFIEFALGFIDDLGGRLLTLPPKEFDLCKNILFKSGFWVDSEETFYTPEISPLYRLRTTKKEPSNAHFPVMVGGAGFEPAANRV